MYYNLLTSVVIPLTQHTTESALTTSKAFTSIALTTFVLGKFREANDRFLLSLSLIIKVLELTPIAFSKELISLVLGLFNDQSSIKEIDPSLA